MPGHVKVRREKFGSVIFDIAREKVYVTSEVGGDILDMLGGGKTLDEIVDHLSDLYDCSQDIIKRDVLEFMEELRKAGLLGEIKREDV
ncbi:MAG: PqqD family protein [Nitrososphaerales archaeon]